MSYVEFAGIIRPDPRGSYHRKDLSELFSAYKVTSLDRVSTSSKNAVIIASKGIQRMEYRYGSQLLTEVFADLAYIIRLAHESGVGMEVKSKFSAEAQDDVEGILHVTHLSIEDGKLFGTTDKYNTAGYSIRTGKAVEISPAGHYAKTQESKSAKRGLFGKH